MTLKEEFHELIMERMKETLEVSIHNMVMELPRGDSSSIADKLYVEQTGKDEFTLYSETPVWRWLSDGTGIYNPYQAGGAGPGGRIIPWRPTLTGEPVKALTFKNAQIAAALGFPTERVFLRSVKGIRPRWFFERWILSPKLAEIYNNLK